MRLDSIVNQYLSDELLAQLAQASAMPLAAAVAYRRVVLPALVHQLAMPIEASEADARWDMCRQLFLSRLLTDQSELLRTDIGWPDRRRYLAQKVLGAAQVAALTESTAQPAQAVTLLGFLTIMTLAAVGEQAHEADLEPADLSIWLGEQATLVEASRQAAAPRGAPGRVQPATPAPSGGKVKVLSVVGSLAVAALAGSYFLLGTPANATQQEAASPETTVARPPATVETKEAAPAEPTPEVPAAPEPVAVAPAMAAPLVAAPAVLAARPVALGAGGLRDTVGNAAMARQIGGKFNVALGRYTKGEGQPLIVKLVNRATLTVGINSTESLLYKRLSKPNLPRPADIVLDRLTFDLGQARLGAEGAQQLGSVASLLKTFPKARFVVVGHANNQEAQAMRLGLQRATIAVDELVKQGISASRLQAQGMLSTELPTDNDTPEKQAMLQGITLKMSRL